jgi:predicted nucleic acid-binding protein
MRNVVRCAVDTNILLRRSQDSSPQSSAADNAINRLVYLGFELHLFPQNIREFWNTATRPAKNNGLGYSITEVEAAVKRLESTFTILRDKESTYDIWRDLVVKHQVSGVQVHDCFIAASMKAHGINDLLTFNSSDFTRYGINAIDPSGV